MRDLALGLGLVSIVEGLALALLPSRLADLLEFLRAMERDRLRLLGLLAVAGGVALVWVGRG